MSKDVTHVANATDSPLRVYYSTDRLMSADLSKLGASEKPEIGMECNSRIQNIRISSDEFGKIIGEGAIFVTVFVEKGSDPGDWLNISQNFHIPGNRSFIVTASHDIKFQKLGANPWEDEQGRYHKTCNC